MAKYRQLTDDLYLFTEFRRHIGEPYVNGVALDRHLWSVNMFLDTVYTFLAYHHQIPELADFATCDNFIAKRDALVQELGIAANYDRLSDAELATLEADQLALIICGLMEGNPYDPNDFVTYQRYLDDQIFVRYLKRLKDLEYQAEGTQVTNIRWYGSAGRKAPMETYVVDLILGTVQWRVRDVRMADWTSPRLIPVKQLQQFKTGLKALELEYLHGMHAGWYAKYKNRIWEIELTLSDGTVELIKGDEDELLQQYADVRALFYALYHWKPQDPEYFEF